MELFIRIKLDSEKYKGTAYRICLYCGRKFISKGIHNRKCGKCIRNHKKNPDDYYDREQYTFTKEE